MKNIEQHEAAAATPDSLHSGESVNVSRRRFNRSGLIVTGVLLTLASRSAVGGGFVCKSPSGFLSGNTSTHGSPMTCGGRSPGYWGTHPEQWPEPYQPGKCGNSFQSSTRESEWKSCTKASEWEGGTRFRDVFDCRGRGSIYQQYSMMQVIWLDGSHDPYQLGAHLVAAMLNARMGWTPILSEIQIMNIFNEWNHVGYFEPTAGVKWYAPDIVAYLQSTLS